MRLRTRAQAGFTLLEVILAMTALAMVTGIVYAAFHLGVRAVERGQASVVSAQRARAAADVMRRQIKSMFPYRCDLDDGDERPFFQVSDNPPKIEFVTAAGLHGGGGLEYVRYEVRGDPPQLVLTVSPHFWFERRRCDDPKFTDATEAVLLDGVRSIAFRPQTYEEGERWRPGETEFDLGLPRSIHVEIDGLPGSTAVTEWRIPIVANLEDQDEGYGPYERIYEGVPAPGIESEDGEEAAASDGTSTSDAEDAESDEDDPDSDDEDE